MRNFLKYFSIPGLLIIGLIAFAVCMAWKEFQTQNMVIDQALEGNRYAIAILRQYEKPWKLDSKVLNGALQGNQYALEILKIVQEANAT